MQFRLAIVNGLNSCGKKRSCGWNWRKDAIPGNVTKIKVGQLFVGRQCLSYKGLTAININRGGCVI